MVQEQLFSLALGLVPPWLVDRVSFSVEEKRLDLYIDFPHGSRFACPVCGRECPVHDTVESQWRHLDFFQHAVYLHALVPRVKCPEHGVHQVPVPWAREGSGFTLLFEALLMTLVREMPVRAVARLVREHDTRLWRVIDHYVTRARQRVDMAVVRAVGLDETSNRRSRDYITLFVDLPAKRLLFATPGKDAHTAQAFVKDLQAHGGDPKAIAEVSMDLSPAFQKGVTEHLSKALDNLSWVSQWTQGKGRVFNLDYEYIQGYVDQTGISGAWPVAHRFQILASYQYGVSTHQPLEMLGGIGYDGGCWDARFYALSSNITGRTRQ